MNRGADASTVLDGCDSVRKEDEDTLLMSPVGLETTKDELTLVWLTRMSLLGELVSVLSDVIDDVDSVALSEERVKARDKELSAVCGSGPAESFDLTDSAIDELVRLTEGGKLAGSSLAIDVVGATKEYLVEVTGPAVTFDDPGNADEEADFAESGETGARVEGTMVVGVANKCALPAVKVKLAGELVEYEAIDV